MSGGDRSQAKKLAPGALSDPVVVNTATTEGPATMLLIEVISPNSQAAMSLVGTYNNGTTSSRQLKMSALPGNRMTSTAQFDEPWQRVQLRNDGPIAVEIVKFSAQAAPSHSAQAVLPFGSSDLPTGSGGETQAVTLYDGNMPIDPNQAPITLPFDNQTFVASIEVWASDPVAEAQLVVLVNGEPTPRAPAFRVPYSSGQPPYIVPIHGQVGLITLRGQVGVSYVQRIVLRVVGHTVSGNPLSPFPPVQQPPNVQPPLYQPPQYVQPGYPAAPMPPTVIQPVAPPPVVVVPPVYVDGNQGPGVLRFGGEKVKTNSAMTCRLHDRRYVEAVEVTWDDDHDDAIGYVSVDDEPWNIRGGQDIGSPSTDVFSIEEEASVVKVHVTRDNAQVREVRVFVR